MRQYVLLEIGVARVTPNVETNISSFVHDHLVRRGQLGEYDDNRPRVGNKKNYWNPAEDYDALRCPPGDRRNQILRAYDDIEPMFWGPRIALDEACETIRTWVAATF